MRKFGSFLIVFMLLISTIVPRAVFADNEISVRIDGRFIEFDVPPQLINDRTMVPLRAIFEELGTRVEWDNDTQTVTATRDDISVIVTIGSRTMYVNNSRKSMDVAPIIINSRTLIPARFVAEAFDCDVEWNGTSQIVEITSYYVEDNDNEDEEAKGLAVYRTRTGVKYHKDGCPHLSIDKSDIVYYNISNQTVT